MAGPNEQTRLRDYILQELLQHTSDGAIAFILPSLQRYRDNMPTKENKKVMPSSPMPYHIAHLAKQLVFYLLSKSSMYCTVEVDGHVPDGL